MTLEESINTTLMPCLSISREKVLKKLLNEDGSVNPIVNQLLELLTTIHKTLGQLGFHDSPLQQLSFLSRRGSVNLDDTPGEVSETHSTPVPKEQDDYFLELRSHLLRLSRDPVFAGINPSALPEIQAILLALAEKYPVNESSFITLDPLESVPIDSMVYLSDGYRFIISEIIKFNLNKSEVIHPYTNSKLSPLDVCHLINATIQRHLKDPEMGSITIFLKKLGNPYESKYQNDLIFLLDEKGHPYRIYKPVLEALCRDYEKVELIIKSKNIIEALYSNTLSVHDLNSIGLNNLSLIDKFAKSVRLLREPVGPLFLSALKSSTRLEVFSKLNSPYFDAIETESSVMHP